MAGHSKWANTKHRKAAADAKKGKVFSRLSKEITLAAKSGGGDATTNAKLRTVLLKAREANMPADNIDRAVKKGTGELPGVVYEEIVYEGYGPNGVAIIVEVTTDNKNRAASEVRSTFTKRGGTLGGSNSVAFMFSRSGQFLVAKDQAEELQLMEIALEAGADDVKVEEEYYEVLCPLSAYDSVSQALADAKIETVSSELAYLPATLSAVSDPDAARQVLRLIEALDDLDDVQNVFHNADIPDELLAEG